MPIERVFVLMLENRSFDHMLGFSGIPGINGLNPMTQYNHLPPHTTPPGKKIFARAPADFKLTWFLDRDPGHEFQNTLTQLCGPLSSYPDPATRKYPRINNSGFAWDYFKLGSRSPRKIMDGFLPSQVPVLTKLAQEYAVCDAWYSSMPGPTFPNRFFLHAGSSAGLDHSPPWHEILARMQVIGTQPMGGLGGWSFQHGTIFDWLDNANIDWRIYEGDRLPPSGAIQGMAGRLNKFYPYSQQNFEHDLNADEFTPRYIFIEPNYGHYILPPWDFSGGTSQHPRDDIRRGEQLIKDIYETIRDSPYWDTSLLLITYDEHGGFYDHMPPPQATPPGDREHPGNNWSGFDFSQYGVRVPAIVVSPLLPRGHIDQNIYDHSSLLRTLLEAFPSLKQHGRFTNRIKAATHFLDLCSLKIPRQDRPVIPDPAYDFAAEEPHQPEIPAGQGLSENNPIPPEVASFIHVAYLRDRELLRQNNQLVQEQEQLFHRMQEIRNLGQASEYAQEVTGRINEYYLRREEDLGLPI